MGRIRVVASAVLAAKEEMRRKFWEEHIKVVEEHGGIEIYSVDAIAKKCCDENLVLEQRLNGTYFLFPANKANILKQIADMDTDRKPELTIPAENPDRGSAGYILS